MNEPLVMHVLCLDPILSTQAFHSFPMSIQNIGSSTTSR